MSKPFIVTGLDTETTGLAPENGHRVIELCAAMYSVENAEVTHRETYTQRYNPGRSIDEGAARVHGINSAMLTNEPKMETCIERLAGILEETDLLVIHNAAFDVGFLAAEFTHCKHPLPSVDVLCTMDEGRFAHPKGGAPNLGLLCQCTGVDYNPDDAHAADYDVACMMRAFFEGVRRGGFQVSNFPALQALVGRRDRNFITLAA